MNVKISLNGPYAKIPTYATDGSAGLDLYATTIHQGDGYTQYNTDISVQIPEGYVGLIFPRSSISNTRFSLANSVGVLDSDFRGNISFRFRTIDISLKSYNTGHRIGQLVILPYPKINLELVDELDDTERSDGGYGSTGR